MSEYQSARRKNDDLVTIDSLYYGHAIWTRVKLVRDKTCRVCKTALPKGMRAFSPITNGQNRMHRICCDCVDKLVRGVET